VSSSKQSRVSTWHTSCLGKYSHSPHIWLDWQALRPLSRLLTAPALGLATAPGLQNPANLVHDFSPKLPPILHTSRVFVGDDMQERNHQVE
jgi:hypothetical protein